MKEFEYLLGPKKGSKSCIQRCKVSFVNEPRRIRFLGIFIVWLSLLVNTIFIVFGDLTSQAVAYGRAACFALTATGAGIAAWGDVSIAPFWALFGIPLFTIGSAILPFSLGFSYQAVGAGTVVVAEIGIIFILLSSVLFVVQGLEDFRKPFFGPNNYFLHSSVLLFLGCCISIVSTAFLFPNVPQLIPNKPVLLVGSALLMWSLFCMLCSNSQVLTNRSFIFLNKFPSTSVLYKDLIGAFFVYIGSLLSMASAFGASLASFFISFSGVSWALVAFAAILFLDSVTKALVFIISVRDVLSFFSGALHAFGYGLLGASFGGPLDISSKLLITAGCCICAGSFLHLIVSIRLKSPDLFCSGNFGIFDALFSFSSGLSLIVSGAVLSVECVHLWGLLLFLSKILQTYLASNIVEVSTAFNFKQRGWDSDFAIPQEVLETTDWTKNEEKESADVIICGGGPAGLTAANELGIRGHKVLLFDQKAQVVPDSRFFVCNGLTMEGMARLGIADMLVERGQQEDFGNGNFLSSGMAHSDTIIFGRSVGYSREIAQRLGSSGSKLAASRSYNSVWAYQMTQRVMQSVQEACLSEKARTYPNVKILFSHNIVDFRIEKINKQCLVLVQAPDGTNVVFKSRFLLGCDGAQSTVSRILKTRFDGFMHLSSSRSLYFFSKELLEQVRLKIGEGHQYQVVRENVGVGYFALRNAKLNLWTFHLHGLFDGRIPGAIETAEMCTILEEFLGPNISYELITDGRWRWNFAVARTFCKPPVFLAGDAAHSWPPFAGNGGNTAYQDVQNLCWKISSILHGWAGPFMATSYDIERRAVTMVGAVGVTTYTPQPGRLKFAAKALLSRLLRFVALSHWRTQVSGDHLGNPAGQGGLQMGVRYSVSPIVPGGNDPKAPSEDPFCSFVPKVYAGGRVLHVKLRDVPSIQCYVNHNGYTLIQTAEDAAEDVELLTAAFAKLDAPLFVKNATETLLDPCRGKRNEYAASLWKKARAVICRPDLYVGWTLSTGGKLTSVSANHLARQLCGHEFSNEDEALTRSFLKWSAWRVIQQMIPLSHLFRKAVFVVDKEKEVDSKNLTKGVILNANDRQNALYQQASGLESQLDSIPLENIPGADPNSCNFCETPIDEFEICWLNGKKLHAHCIPSFRKKVGFADKICAYCGGYVLPGKGKQIKGLKQPVHTACSESFEAQCAEDAANPDLELNYA